MGPGLSGHHELGANFPGSRSHREKGPIGSHHLWVLAEQYSCRAPPVGLSDSGAAQHSEEAPSPLLLSPWGAESGGAGLPSTTLSPVSTWLSISILTVLYIFKN